MLCAVVHREAGFPFCYPTILPHLSSNHSSPGSVGELKSQCLPWSQVLWRPKTLLTPCLVLAILRLLRSACSLVSQEYSGSVCHSSSHFNLRNHVSLGPNPTAAQLFIHCHLHQEGWSKVWEDLSRIHRAKLYPGCRCSALAGSCTLILAKGLLPQFVRDRASVCHSHRG